MISEHQQEQLDTWLSVQRICHVMNKAELRKLYSMISEYVDFRNELRRFFQEHLEAYCRRKCFVTGLSACCGKDSIVVHFADIVVNVLLAENMDNQSVIRALSMEPKGYACVYLGPDGCLCTMTPIVCAMFLCDSLVQDRIKGQRALEENWRILNERRNMFTWPDRPVLFDQLEQFFLAMGFRSNLMQYHFGPGLLQVKRKAGLIPAVSSDWVKRSLFS